MRQDILIKGAVVLLAALFPSASCSEECSPSDFDSNGNLLQATKECNNQTAAGAAAPTSLREEYLSESVDFLGRTALHTAVRKVTSGKSGAALRSQAAVQKLLAGRPSSNPMARDKAGQTPLHLAAAQTPSSGEEVVQLLVSSNADPDALDDLKRTPLHVAAYHGHSAMVENIVAVRASLNLQDHGGLTPLLLAARLGKLDAALSLVTARADTAYANNDGRTALHEAASARHAVIIQLLLEADAAVNVRDRWERTPLHEAARSGAHEAAELIMAYGAKIHFHAPRADRNHEQGSVRAQDDAVLHKREIVKAIFENPPPFNKCPNKKKILPDAGGSSGGVVEMLANFFSSVSSQNGCSRLASGQPNWWGKSPRPETEEEKLERQKDEEQRRQEAQHRMERAQQRQQEAEEKQRVEEATERARWSKQEVVSAVKVTETSRLNSMQIGAIRQGAHVDVLLESMTQSDDGIVRAYAEMGLLKGWVSINKPDSDYNYLKPLE